MIEKNKIELRHDSKGRHTDDMNYICILRSWYPDQKIIWLDITVDQRLVVDGLNPCDLYRRKEH